MYKDYTNYDILPDGRIWSKYSNKFLKPYTMKNGYQRVCLISNEGKRDKQLVHRITWMAVNGVWEIPKGFDIHHIDECTANNHITNLLLCSHQENCNHGTRNSRVAKALSKRVGAYDKNGELVMCFPSIAEAGRLGYDHGAVCNCCRGKLPHYKGFNWKYLDE